MKGLISATLLLVVLSGCTQKPAALNQKQVHFAAIAVASDLMEKGTQSDYVPLIMPGLDLAKHVMEADSIIADMAKNPEAAENKYRNLLKDKIQMQGIVEVGTDYGDHDIWKRQFEFIRRSFQEGEYHYNSFKLHAIFGEQQYPDKKYPSVPKGTNASVVCSKFDEWRPSDQNLKAQKNNSIEVFFSQCVMTDDALKTSVKNDIPAITKLLSDIYTGKTQVDRKLAEKLADVYASAASLPADSICLSGSYDDCMVQLDKSKLVSKPEDVGAIMKSIKIEAKK